MFDDLNPEEKEGLIDLANKVYDDGLKKSVQAAGDCMSLFFRAINAALSPIEKLILYKEHSTAITKKMLEEKLNNVNVNDIVSPEPYVAVPAINAVSCCINSDELRNLYANLIARSMLKNEKAMVHPAFVEIIKQLSPTDAAILKILYNKFLLSVPMVNVNLKNRKTGSYIPIIKNICEIPGYDYSTIASSIENLNRLKLFDISLNSYIENSTYYDSIKNSPNLTKFLDSKVLYDSDEFFEFKMIASSPTQFGLNFCNICIKDL